MPSKFVCVVLVATALPVPLNSGVVPGSPVLVCHVIAGAALTVALFPFPDTSLKVSPEPSFIGHADSCAGAAEEPKCGR